VKLQDVTPFRLDVAMFENPTVGFVDERSDELPIRTL
jgi:hypothetical protein